MTLAQAVDAAAYRLPDALIDTHKFDYPYYRGTE